MKFPDRTWYQMPPTVNARSYCKECADKKEAQDKEEEAIYIKIKKKRMFEKACEILEKQNVDMYRLKDAIKAVEEYLTEKPDKFDSSYEVLTAIILIYNRIRVKMQCKIGDFQVDFVLPEYSLVLEVDGDRHKHRKGYDSVRDETIKRMLGGGWSIMRVDTSDLDKKALKLPEAIDKFLDYQETKRIDWRAL